MHYLYYFSYPASPIATTDLNMLPLFYGCCTNKFVVMQARYRPLSSFHLLKLHPRSSAHYTLVNVVRDLLYIPDRGLSQRKARYSLQRELDPTRPPGRILLFKPGPICGQVGLNHFSCTIFGFGRFFLGFQVRKVQLYPTYCFLWVENFCPNWSTYWLDWAFWMCRVRFIGLDCP